MFQIKMHRKRLSEQLTCLVVKAEKRQPQPEKAIGREIAMTHKLDRRLFVLFWATDHLPGNDPDVRLVKFPNSVAVAGFKFTDEYRLPERVYFVANFATLEWNDFPANNANWPLMSPRMLEALESVGSFPHRRIPVTLVDSKAKSPFDDLGNPRPGMAIDERFVAVQLTEHLDAFDWDNSEYERSPFASDRVKIVTKLILKEPPGGYPPLFRLSATPRHLLVSAAAREALEGVGVRGVVFWDIDRIVMKRPRDRRTRKTVIEQRRTPTERPLTKDEREAIDVLWQNGVECIGFVVDLPRDLSDSSLVVGKIREFIDSYREGQRPGGGYEDAETIAYAVGTLWGEAAREALGWEWVHVTDEGGSERLVVVSQDRAYLCDPHLAIFRLLTRPDVDNGSALVFNMLRAEKAPSSKPGSYHRVW
jgi:hypothetical protein